MSLKNLSARGFLRAAIFLNFSSRSRIEASKVGPPITLRSGSDLKTIGPAEGPRGSRHRDAADVRLRRGGAGLRRAALNWFFWAEGKAWGHREGFKNGYEQGRDDTVLEMLGISREDGQYLWNKVRAEKTRR
jgi:hypothetical protein